MIQPRVGATWAYNGTDTVFASYARTTPRRARCRAPRRGIATFGTFIDNHFDANGVLFGVDAGRLVVRQAVRRRPDAAHDRRVHVGTRGSSDRRSSMRAATGAIVTAATSGKTPTTTRALPSTRRPAFPRELYIPDLERAARADRQRVDLRHRRARRRVHEVLRGTVESEWRADRGVRPRLVHLEPLLRQLRPGQLDHGQRRQRLHRIVDHRRRRRPPAVGLQGRRSPRRPPAHVQGCTATTTSRGTRPPARSSSRSRVSRGKPGATNPTSRSRPAPATSTAWLNQPAPARSDSHCAGGPELHPELPAGRAASTCSSTPTCSTCSTIRPVTTTSPPCTASAFATPRSFYDPRRVQLAARLRF